MGKKYVESCPVCGRKLFTGLTELIVEMNCPKCKSFLHIIADSSGIHTQVIEKTENKALSDKLTAI